MGTQQELTTEQLEVLILIDDVNNYITENKVDLESSIVEILDNLIKTKEAKLEICKTLEHYGYIGYDEEDESSEESDYLVTEDGKQYIRLFKEYLDAKSENISITHNSYSLINIGKLQMKIDACLGKANISANLGDVAELIKGVAKKIIK